MSNTKVRNITLAGLLATIIALGGAAAAWKTLGLPVPASESRVLKVAEFSVENRYRIIRQDIKDLQRQRFENERRQDEYRKSRESMPEWLLREREAIESDLEEAGDEKELIKHKMKGK